MSEKNKYYNYVSFYRGIPVYVGKGLDKRWEHTVNGQSGSELINDFYFRYKYFNDMPLDTYIVKRYKTNEQAIKGEKRLINKYLPYCNKCSGREHASDYDFYKKLERVSLENGFDSPEVLYSKFDFRFLFTPKGLLCTRTDLAENSPFERTDEAYHIKVKSSLYVHFPEYFLQFMEHDSETHGYFLSSFHSKPLFLRMFEMGDKSLFGSLKVDIDWKVDALTRGSFDFAEEFGFTYDNFKLDKFKYEQTVMESHVVAYTKHLEYLKTIQQREELKAKRKLEKQEERERKKALAIADESQNTKIGVEYDNIRVKVSGKVLEYAESVGFDISGEGEWLNLSRQIKPFRSISRLLKYKPISEEDFLISNLGWFKKKPD